MEQVDNMQEQMSNMLRKRPSSCPSLPEMRAGLPAVWGLGRSTDRLCCDHLSIASLVHSSLSLSGTLSRIKPAASGLAAVG